MKFTQNVKKVGYETVVALTTNGSYIAANALASDGTVLGTTDVWDLALGATVSIWTRIPLLPLPRYVPFLAPCTLCLQHRTFAFLDTGTNTYSFSLPSIMLELQVFAPLAVAGLTTSTL